MRSLALVPLMAACALFAQDLDRDGIDDALEQQVIERFLPTFLVSGGDCDGLPAEFEPGAADPRVVNRNGTVYAQVFRPPNDESQMEIHYYHLWARDCGRGGHPLDAEHVAVLIGGDGKAVYWYAAAHYDTICDAGNGARASALHAGNRGATVWMSTGKHASFLSHALCAKGCGGDRCEQMTVMPVPRVINIGEWDYPMNGAVWIRSKAWDIRPKMQPVFTQDVTAQLDLHAEVAGHVNAAPVPVQATVMAGGKTIDAVSTGNRHTEAALDTASDKTDDALTTAARRTSSSLKRATRATGNFLGIGKSKKP